MDTCLRCAPGTFQSGAAATSELNCSLCPAGTFQAGIDDSLPSACTDCPQGSYSAWSSSQCTFCSAGKYSDVNTSQSFKTNVNLSSASFDASFPANAAKFSALVDGNIALNLWQAAPGTAAATCTSQAYVQVDVGQQVMLTQVVFWNYYDGRRYCNISIELSSTCAFAGEQVSVFSCSEYSSCPNVTSSGHQISFDPVQARCVRWSSSRNNKNDGIHFLEIQLVQPACCCASCPAGTYQTGTGVISSVNCTQCGPGKYQTRLGAISESGCSLCSAGKYFTGFALASQLDCTSCLPGKYQSGLGRISEANCSLCRVGEYQSSSSAPACSLCEPGTYQTGVGAETCRLCTAGTYQSGSGGQNASACLKCPMGHFSLGGSSVCSMCEAGKFANEYGNASYAQAALTASSVTASWGMSSYSRSALVGSLGSLADVSAMLWPSALSCSNRSYVQVDVREQMMLTQVIFWNYYDGRRYCNISIELSSTCAFAGEQVSVFACSEYSSCPNMTSSGHQISFDPVQARCVRWSSSRSTSSPNIEFVSLRMYEASCCCTTCSAGTYQTGQGAVNCSLCLAGTYQTASSSINCSLCGPGTYHTLTGQTSCAQCGSGVYQSTSGQTFCSACSPGSYQAGTGASAVSSCTPCGLGNFTNRSGSAFCRMCEPGQYNNITGASFCTNCPPFTYGSSSSQSTCQVCFSTQRSGASTCAKCPPGSYLSGQSSASTCAAVGERCTCNSSVIYGPVWGWLSSPDPHSTLCVADAFNGNETFYTGLSSCHCIFGCSLCEAGTFSTALASPSNASCFSCSSGTYSSTKGSFNCTPCQPGTFGTGLGQTACSVCPLGMYLGSRGATSRDLCLPCSPGTYSAQVGSGNCVPCMAGTYQTGKHQTSCLRCAVGTYANSTGRSACLACPSKMTSFSGSKSIQECYCTFGYVNVSSAGSGCADVNECAQPGKCNPFENCVNTAGSFTCTTNTSQRTSICQNVYPSTCSIVGGDIMWVSVPPNSAGSPKAVAKFSSDSVEVYWANTWAQVVCPPSPKAGRTSSTIFASDGQPICAFSLVYTPGAAVATPKSFNLDGGPFALNFTGWNYAVDQGLCQILVGEESAGIAFLSPSSPTVVTLIAPGRKSSGIAAVTMTCEGAAGRLDLGLSLEYRDQARAVLNNGLPCVQFRPCDVNFAVWPHPCWRYGVDDLVLTVVNDDLHFQSPIAYKLLDGLSSQVYPAPWRRFNTLFKYYFRLIRREYNMQWMFGLACFVILSDYT